MAKGVSLRTVAFGARHESASYLYDDKLKNDLIKEYYGAAGAGGYYERRIDWFKNEYETLRRFAEEEEKKGSALRLKDSLPDILRPRPASDAGEAIGILVREAEAALKIVQEAEQDQAAPPSKRLPPPAPS